MVQPKRLITLDARTDAIAERVKRTTKYGFSSWVRTRLLAWNAEREGGHDAAMQALRDARRTAELQKCAEILARRLSGGDKCDVGEDWSVIFGAALYEAKRLVNEEQGVIE